MKLHERISDLRKKNKLTQQRVADYLGISRGAYANYETGAREPDAESLAKLADLFGVSVDVLLGRIIDPMTINFGKILKTLREKKGLTQKELGKILNVSESTIGMYERGEREPNFETLEKIADFFEVQVDYLLGRDTSNIKVKYEDLDAEERQIIRDLQDIANGHGYKLTDPEFLQIVEAAFEFAKRMPKDQRNQ